MSTSHFHACSALVQEAWQKVEERMHVQPFEAWVNTETGEMHVEGRTTLQDLEVLQNYLKVSAEQNFRLHH